MAMKSSPSMGWQALVLAAAVVAAGCEQPAPSEPPGCEPGQPGCEQPAEEVDTLEILAGNTATGFVDGKGEQARFSGPSGAALSPDGAFLYVADTFNNLLRRVDTATGEVTTLAGRVQQQAAVDGRGTEARFKSPRALVITPDGRTLYLADAASVRRISLPDLEVTTLAGSADFAGNVDEVGDSARLGLLLHSLALSEDGRTLYLADRSNRVLRALDLATRRVSTVAGTAYTGAVQSVDGVGPAARFSGVGGLWRVGSALYLVDTFNHTLRRVDLQTFQVATVAGTPGRSGFDDGVGAAALFNTPQSLTGDSQFLYITGWGGLLRRVSLSDFTTTSVIGVKEDVRPVDGSGAQVRLGNAFGPPLMDSAKRVLYYNDRDASSLRRLNLDTLEMTTLAGSREPSGSADGAAGSARFNDPVAVVADRPAGLWYVADAGNHTLRRVVAATGEVSTVAGQAGVSGAVDGTGSEATFNLPSGLALDVAGGRLYVSDRGNHVVRVVELASRRVQTLAGTAGQRGSVDGTGAQARFNAPRHMALSADGRTLYVADSGNSTVRAVAADTGAVTTLAGTAGAKGSVNGVGSAARFRTPAGLALNAATGQLYVSDREASTLRVINLATAEVSTLAGQDQSTGAVDGVLAEALFRSPSGLALSEDGTRLYVVEVSNHLIRRVDLKAGTVSTWLGNSVRSGGMAPGTRARLEEATLYFPESLALMGPQVALLSEDALYVARLRAEP